jgi:hypothetical protein
MSAGKIKQKSQNVLEACPVDPEEAYAIVL